MAPSGLGGGGGDRHELIVTWTVSGGRRVVPVVAYSAISIIVLWGHLAGHLTINIDITMCNKPSNCFLPHLNIKEIIF